MGGTSRPGRPPFAAKAACGITEIPGPAVTSIRPGAAALSYGHQARAAYSDNRTGRGYSSPP